MNSEIREYVHFWEKLLIVRNQIIFRPDLAIIP